MAYIALGIVFVVLFACFAFLDEKRKEQSREINSIYDLVSRQNDRVSAFQSDRNAVVRDLTAVKTAVQALEDQVKELSEPLRVKDKQEKLILEGMTSILNYNINEAVRAAKDVRNYGVEEE